MYFPGDTACNFRMALVVPGARRAVTSTGTLGFGWIGSWRTSGIAPDFGSAATDHIAAPAVTSAARRRIAMIPDRNVVPLGPGKRYGFIGQGSAPVRAWS